MNRAIGTCPCKVGVEDFLNASCIRVGDGLDKLEVRLSNAKYLYWFLLKEIAILAEPRWDCRTN
jgi:hypothetical protein